MSIISLKNVEAISRGDDLRKLKYLKQFTALIPERCAELEHAVQNDDRTTLGQILHKMSPQVQFFGIREVEIPFARLAHEHKSMEYAAMRNEVMEIVRTLDTAVEEVKQLLTT